MDRRARRTRWWSSQWWGDMRDLYPDFSEESPRHESSFWHICDMMTMIFLLKQDLIQKIDLWFILTVQNLDRWNKSSIWQQSERQLRRIITALRSFVRRSFIRSFACSLSLNLYPSICEGRWRPTSRAQCTTNNVERRDLNDTEATPTSFLWFITWML